jgi:hypothetical protein
MCKDMISLFTMRIVRKTYVQSSENYWTLNKVTHSCHRSFKGWLWEAGYFLGEFCKHVRKCTHSVTFLALLTELDLWPLFVAGIFHLNGGEVPRATIPRVGIPYPAQCIVGLYVNYVLLSDRKLNWNASTDLSKRPYCQLWIYVQPLRVVCVHANGTILILAPGWCTHHWSAWWKLYHVRHWGVPADSETKQHS